MEGVITYCACRLQFKKSGYTMSISRFVPETKFEYQIYIIRIALRLQGFYLIFLYFLLISGSYIAEHFHSVLMLNLEKHYKALGKDKLSYYRNVLYTGYIHWQKDVPSHNSSTTKIKSSKLAIRILFVTIVIRIYVLAWSCKKGLEFRGLWQRGGKKFFIKIGMDY